MWLHDFTGGDTTSENMAVLEEGEMGGETIMLSCKGYVVEVCVYPVGPGSVKQVIRQGRAATNSSSRNHL